MLHNHTLASLAVIAVFVAVALGWDVIRYPADYGMPAWRERFRR